MGVFKMTPKQLEAAITPNTRMLILCSPSNPTGSVYTAEELEALATVTSFSVVCTFFCRKGASIAISSGR